MTRANGMLALFFPLLMTACSQMPAMNDTNTAAEAFAAHGDYRESAIVNFDFAPCQVYELIDTYRSNPSLSIEQLGESVQRRPIYAISLGGGPNHVLLWSQMHGDEPTATAAIFDLLRFLTAAENSERVRGWKQQLTLHFIPMLNPDGAAAFRRRNAQGIDINRDALRLQTPEGRILKGAVDRWQPLFGFNLHDQNRYYSAASAAQPATLSFLAPAFDEAKTVNPVRRRAIQLIGLFYRQWQTLVPGQIGRYDDTWEPRAFGDNIQGWGTSTILIESGGSPDDPGRELPRQLNFAALIASIEAITQNQYQEASKADYESIPFNRTLLFDLLIRQVTVPLADGGSYVTDIGINYSGKPGCPNCSEGGAAMEDWGDLSTYSAYEVIDATGMVLAATECEDRGNCLVDPTTLANEVSFDLVRNDTVAFRIIDGVPEQVEKQ